MEFAAESIEDSSAAPMHQPANDANVPQTPDRLTTPAIHIQEATPTTPTTFYSPSSSPSKVSTNCLVDSFLEVPQKVYSELLSEDSNEQVFSTVSPTPQPGRQAGADSTEEPAQLITEGPAINSTPYDNPPKDILSGIEVQQQAHSSPIAPKSTKALEARTIARSESSTIRLVDSSLDMTVKHGVDSLGKRWKGQPGFLSL